MFRLLIILLLRYFVLLNLLNVVQKNLPIMPLSLYQCMLVKFVPCAQYVILIKWIFFER